jgi:6-pyruvoyltetrahydropterin/6-carboxytetrahydropterin synthase
MHSITKDFDFCYGHRVWTQTLDDELSCGTACKCRHLHGHQGKITVKLTSSDLEDGMVTDFHHLNFFKKFVDDHFDHKMIMHWRDPLLGIMLEDLWPMLHTDPATEDPSQEPYWIEVPCKCFPAQAFYYPNPKLMDRIASAAVLEMIEGLVVVNFVPTSENLSMFFFYHIKDVLNAKSDVVNKWMKLDSVIFQETPKTSAVFF